MRKLISGSLLLLCSASAFAANTSCETVKLRESSFEEDKFTKDNDSATTAYLNANCNLEKPFSVTQIIFAGMVHSENQGYRICCDRK